MCACGPALWFYKLALLAIMSYWKENFPLLDWKGQTRMEPFNPLFMAGWNVNTWYLYAISAIIRVLFPIQIFFYEQQIRRTRTWACLNRQTDWKLRSCSVTLSSFTYGCTWNIYKTYWKCKMKVRCIASSFCSATKLVVSSELVKSWGYGYEWKCVEETIAWFFSSISRNYYSFSCEVTLKDRRGTAGHQVAH